MSLQRNMQPVVVAGLALFVALQALTGFATNGENVVPEIQRKAHVARQRMGGLIATPAGAAPRASNRAMAYNVAWVDGQSVLLPIDVELRCRTLARRVLNSQLAAASDVRIERGSTDRWGRTQGRIYTRQGTDIAQTVQERTRAHC
jgi:hypothetical protein